MDAISAEALQSHIVAAYREAKMESSVLLSTERILKSALFSGIWRGNGEVLKPKGAIQLFFDARNPVRSFDRFFKNELVQHEAGADR